MRSRLRWGIVFLGLVLLATPGVGLMGLAVLGATREAEFLVLGRLLTVIARAFVGMT